MNVVRVKKNNKVILKIDQFEQESTSSREKELELTDGAGKKNVPKGRINVTINVCLVFE